MNDLDPKHVYLSKSRSAPLPGFQKYYVDRFIILSKLFQVLCALLRRKCISSPPPFGEIRAVLYAQNSKSYRNLCRQNSTYRRLAMYSVYACCIILSMYRRIPRDMRTCQKPVLANSTGSHISFKGKSSHVTFTLSIEKDPSPVRGL